MRVDRRGMKRRERDRNRDGRSIAMTGVGLKAASGEAQGRTQRLMFYVNRRVSNR